MHPLKFLTIIDLQARTSLKSEASKTYLSYLWWVIEPLLFVLIFYLVFATLLARDQEQFVFFLMCGKIPYLWFSKSVTISANSILENKGLIVSIEIPKVIFPYIAVQEVLYKQWVVLGVLLITALYFQQYPHSTWLLLIPLLITNHLLNLCCSLISAILVTYVQDFRILINMGLLFLMFISGIFWDISNVSNEALRQVLLICNPLAFLIEGYRSVLMDSVAYDLKHLGLLATILTILIAITHHCYSKIDKSLALKVIQA